ncbi:MAG: Mth938-like domain-containing protein [Candidatus Methanofastidiosia archaeon]
MIQNYSFGSIVIDGKTYTSDVIIYPKKVDSGWWRKEGHLLQISDLSKVIESEPEILIVGTGNSGLMKISPEVKNLCKTHGIQLISEETSKACMTYNRLKDENKVVACLHLTC